MDQEPGIGLKVSVIVPSYRRGGDLVRLLADLLAQSEPPLEVLVVDQCPEHAEADEREIARICSGGVFRRLVMDRANAQAARNAGLRESRGEICLMVDDDVRVGPDFVAAHRRNYLSDPGIDGVVGQVLLPGQSPSPEFGPEFDWPVNGWMFFPMNYDRRAELINWPSCNASIRRSLAVEAGGFDEQFERTWFDDADFSIRLKRAGARLVYDPEATLVHLRTPAGGNRPQRKNDWLWADEAYWGTLFYFWRKNFGILPVWRHVWWYLRHFIFRKKLLVRPDQFALNWIEVCRGWRHAGRKLMQGPRYMA